MVSKYQTQDYKRTYFLTLIPKLYQCLVQIHNGMFDNIPSYIGKLQLINVFSRVFFCIIFKFYAEFSPASYMDLNIFGKLVILSSY